MAPRINFDDSIESKEEFWNLHEVLKDRDACLGKLVRFFRLAQIRYGKGLPVTDDDLKQHALEVMKETGWAVPVPGGYSSIGADKYFAWYKQKIEAGSKGGRPKKKNCEPNKRGQVEKPGASSGNRGEPDENPLVPVLALAPVQNTEKVESTPSPSQLARVWNENCGTLSKVRNPDKLNSAREKEARSRLKEEPDLEIWKLAIQQMAAAPFCQGKNARNWKADFDFILQPKRLDQALEGKWGGPGQGVTKKSYYASELEKDGQSV